MSIKMDGGATRVRLSKNPGIANGGLNFKSCSGRIKAAWSSLFAGFALREPKGRETKTVTSKNGCARVSRLGILTQCHGDSFQPASIE